MQRQLFTQPLAAGLIMLAVTAGAAGTSARASTPPSSAPPSSTPGDGIVPDGQDCPADRQGGTLSFGVLVEAASFDPLIQTTRGTWGGSELTAVYDTLMAYDPAAGAYYPFLAEGLESADDYTAWTLTLRDGVTYSDGTPLDAEAVAANIARHSEEGSRSTWNKLLTNTVESVDVVDSATVTFRLTRSWPGFPALLASSVGMVVNPTVAAEGGTEALQAGDPAAGVGPFTIGQRIPGEATVLEAKDDYWGGRPCLDELRFVGIPGAQSTYDGFKAGDLDVAFLRDAQVIAAARTDGVGGEHSSLVNGGSMLMINNGAYGRTPPTVDVRIRQAIAHAIDADLLNERLTAGTGLPSTALFAEGSRLYQGLSGPEYDPDLARQLVEEVKAEGEWDGSISIEMNSTTASTNLGIAVVGMLEAVGIEATLDASAASNELTGRVVNEGDYTITGWSLSISDSSPWPELVERLSDNVYTGYDNPDMDEALDALGAAVTEDEELAAAARIQEVWNETVPSVIYGATEDVVVWDSDVHGMVPTLYSVMMFHRASLD